MTPERCFTTVPFGRFCSGVLLLAVAGALQCSGTEPPAGASPGDEVAGASSVSGAGGSEDAEGPAAEAGAAGSAAGAAQATSGTGGLAAGGASAADAEDSSPQVEPGMGGDPPELTENVTLHLVGDSTAASFPETDPTGRVGWGVALPDFFVETVSVNNAARSGRSSKSYYDEGLWAPVKAAIKPGDYVFIQFAHNDEKLEDPLRYTNPTTTFRDYLHVYIGETRQAGGFAVLLTPTSRLEYVDGLIADSHRNYPEAILEVGEATGTPVIDMTEKTRVLYDELGQEACRPLFAQFDRTHTSAAGAVVVAGLVVEGIVEHALPLVERLKDSPSAGGAAGGGGASATGEAGAAGARAGAGGAGLQQP